MDPITQQTVLAAAGAAGGDKVYVDDVFSTFLYDGNEGSNQINNGIDLAGEGGLVWFKNRTRTGDAPTLIDTETQSGGYLISSGTAALSGSQPFSSFNSNGYTINSGSFYVNDSSHRYASWTFRKAPGFFDVVTYTGSGSGTKTISHNLGSVPGMIIVKGTNAGSDWSVYHRKLNGGSSPEDWYITLNHTYSQTDAVAVGVPNWGSTAPTATEFTVGGNNNASIDYVAYVFAHDDAQFGTDGDESIIKCGSYVESSSTLIEELGFEPQWVMIKSATAVGPWEIHDVMRGSTNIGGQNKLYADSDSIEQNQSSYLWPTSTGFHTPSGYYGTGGTMIYMAIRRPHKPPEAATEVFDVKLSSDDGGNGILSSDNITADFNILFRRDSGYTYALNRLNGAYYMIPHTGGPVSDGRNYFSFDHPTGMKHTGWFASNPHIDFTFKRAPGFFDLVAYTGNGVADRQISHNLEAVPELMIVKMTDDTDSWQVYDKVNGATNYMLLNSTYQSVARTASWNDTTPTDTVFTVGNDNGVNQDGKKFIAHLFATLPGISKVGSYTSDGNAVDIDCGFTNGARFILIKNSNTGNWNVWDSVRGIVSGNDPHSYLNTATPEVIGTDYIDPLASGFTVTANNNYINSSGSTYIFLAIA